MRIRSESWIEVCQWVGSQSQDNRGYIRQGLVIYACQLTNLAKASHSSEFNGALQLTSQSFFYLG